MGAFLVTIAEQLALVAADQIVETRMLAGVLVGQFDAALSLARDRAIDVCYDLGITPRCARCRAAISEPEVISAGRCETCDHIIDHAVGGKVG